MNECLKTSQQKNILDIGCQTNGIYIKNKNNSNKQQQSKYVK